MKSKLLLWISIALVLVLTGTIIALALIPVNYKPELSDQPISVKITQNSTSHTYNTGKEYPLEKDKENYNKILKAFENGFKQSTLKAIFSGKTSSKITINPVGSIPSKNGYRLEFRFNEPIVLTLNEKPYIPSSHEEDSRILFKTLVVDVIEETENKFVTTNLYAVIDLENGSKNYYEIKTIANFYELSEILPNLPYTA